MGSWVTALSAQPGDMSGRLLMGLPGSGLLRRSERDLDCNCLLVGAVINWCFVDPCLRVYTGKVN